jgi:cell wall assembly regulator SMI1
MSPWLRIDAWLEEHAPEVLAQLLPPATADALSKLERAAGRKLPLSLVEAYRGHDGALEDTTTIFGAMRTTKDTRWATLMNWLSTERIREQLSFLRDLGDWPEERLPIAEDAGGNMLFVDLGTGAVGAFDHEDWTTFALAPDLTTLLNNLADDMDGDLVVLDEDDEIPGLVLLDKPAVAAKQPQITEDRPARVLLEVMLERRMIALAKGKDVEKLVVLLTKALALEEDRREKVVEILEENDAVDELFADDEEMDALLEELG